MKLGIVPARTGTQWVREAVRTFFRQPLALAGLFFMFVAAVSVLSILPVVGSLLALGLFPAANVGLMVATREAAEGRFPMPSVLISAFRASPDRTRSILLLGALYAGSFLLIMGLTALVDGGTFARMYLTGERPSPEVAAAGRFSTATLLAMALYLPVSLAFWHAPALVHWYGTTPAKALFFSLVACLRNLGAYLVYGFSWMAIFGIAGVLVAIFGIATGQMGWMNSAMMFVALFMAAMFFVSTFFTFRDSFSNDDSQQENSA